MPRLLVLCAFAAFAAGCSRDDNGVPRQTVLITDAGGQPDEAVLSPDGTRMAWSKPVEGQQRIFVGQPDGSGGVMVSSGTWDYGPRWSRDGKWVAYTSESPQYDVWVVSADGGEPRQLTSGPANDEANGWTADNSGVIFNRGGAGEARTYVAPLDGGALREVVPHPGGNVWGMVSPDGKMYAYERFVGSQSTIWVQDLAGGAPRQLTTEGFEDGVPSRHMWSPDSKHLVFGSRRTGTLDLWTANVETGELRQITSDVRNDQGHVWSPDGQWIAFHSDRGGQRDIWVVPATGGDAIRVTNDLEVENNVGWYRDGQALQFQRLKIQAGVGILSPDGSTQMLVDWPGYTVGFGGLRFQLSPDNSTVLFVGSRSGNNDIWSVPVAGGEATPFAASPLEDAMPAYSPDGREVAYASNRTGNWDIWVMPAAGGDARRLTESPSNEFRPAWSPDGKWIAFGSEQDSRGSDVWVVSAAGGTPRRLTTLHQDMRGPLYWSPDAASIYLYTSGARGAELYRVPVAGGRPRALQVASSTAGGIGTLSPNGEWYAYARLDGGWARLEITPTSGGAPRTITRTTERVWQPAGLWSPDSRKLATGDWLFGESLGTNIVEFSVDDTTVRVYRSPPKTFWNPEAYLPDGRMIIQTFKGDAAIVKVDISRLLRTP